MEFIGMYFEWGLFVLTVASGLIYLIDQRFFYKRRRAVAESSPDFAALNKKQKLERLRGPLITDYARSLFGVFCIVLLIRSFFFEPYIVPSGSMLPTIQLGDFILVNKFAYGLHLPLTGTKILAVGEPKQGDIVVFKNPENPQVSFVKTVIGLPGDKISYINKQLYINGKILPQQFMGNQIEVNNANLGSALVAEYSSQIGAATHMIYNSPSIPAQNFQNLSVPQGEYFMMGDNRDDSDDSRIWGFVPEKDLEGRASFIFFSFDSDKMHVRWDRIGKKLL